MKSIVVLIFLGCLSGCASFGDAVNGVLNVGFNKREEPKYKNYTGEDAARIRIIFGKTLAYISGTNEQGRQGWFDVSSGVRVNRKNLGLNWDIEPLSLGMPGQTPEYNYSELAVPPGKSVSIQYHWEVASPQVKQWCNAEIDLVPQAKEDYQVVFIMNGSKCRAEKTKLSAAQPQS